MSRPLLARYGLIAAALLLSGCPALLPALPGVVPEAEAGSADKALIRQLDREVIALKQRIALLEQQAGDCSTPGEPPAIYTELRQIFSGSPVQVERQGALVRATLPADLLFTSDGLHLREEAIFSLDLLATALKLHPVTASVIGYTDSLSPPQSARKSWPTAWEWTAAQAALVVRELQDRFGVPPARLEVTGRGSTSLPGNEDTPEGRALNRRIVVEIRSTPTIR